MQTKRHTFATRNSTELTRRRFIASTAATTICSSVLGSTFSSSDPLRKINIGMIGCGKRSNWIGTLFEKHGCYTIYGASDYFAEQADKFGERFNVPTSRRFSGLSGYRQMLALKELDAVVVQSPPYFHPEHAATAVDAGKHVFLAKPIAVDVPGCLSIETTGLRATEKKCVFLVDFQTRTNEAYQHVVNRVQNGGIGRIVSGEAAYNCGPTWGHMDAFLRERPNDPEARLRAWGLDRILSGDIITEQNIHVLDVATWLLNAAPVKAYGTAGAQRAFAGSCNDHFAAVFYFPDNVIVSFHSKQVGFGYDDLLCRMYGTTGTAETHYAGKLTLRAEKETFDGDSPNLFAAGAIANIAAFHDRITRGIYDNPTVAPSVRTNLTTILGRIAAYRQREVTWEDMMKENEQFTFDLKGLKA